MIGARVWCQVGARIYEIEADEGKPVGWLERAETAWSEVAVTQEPEPTVWVITPKAVEWYRRKSVAP